jgi:hypothetical protein
MPHPVFAEGSKPRERFAVFLSVGGGLAGDDVVWVANRKSLHFDVPLPRVREPFNTVWGKDQVEVEEAVLELASNGRRVAESNREFPGLDDIQTRP